MIARRVAAAGALVLSALLGAATAEITGAPQQEPPAPAAPPGCCIEVDDRRQLIRTVGADCGRWQLVLVGCRRD